MFLHFIYHHLLESGSIFSKLMIGSEQIWPGQKNTKYNNHCGTLIEQSFLYIWQSSLADNGQLMLSRVRCKQTAVVFLHRECAGYAWFAP